MFWHVYKNVVSIAGGKQVVSNYVVFVCNSLCNGITEKHGNES